MRDAVRIFRDGNIKQNRAIKRIEDWDESVHYRENAIKTGLSRTAAYYFAKRYGLPTNHRKQKSDPIKIGRAQSILYLRHQLAYSYESIGKIFGISKQAIEQHLKNHTNELRK